MTPIKTVVIGYGYAGSRIHVPLVQLEPGLRLHGICSGDPEKRGQITQRLGCGVYSDFEQVLADPDVQLITLATPNPLHAPHAIAALSAGKHVIVDKPMAIDAAEAAQMCSAADRSGALLSVFHNRRFDSDFMTLRDCHQRGLLGRIRWIEMSWQRSRPPRGWRRESSRGGGRLMDLGSHMIDQVLTFVPSPVISVYCRMHRDYPEWDIESHAMLTLGFSDGSTAIVDTTSQTFAPKPRMLVLGDKATFVKHGMDPQEAALAAGHIDSAREEDANFARIHSDSGVQVIQPIPGRWRTYYERVAAAITTRDPSLLPVSARDGERVMRVLDAAKESAQSGRAVVVDV